MEQNKHTEEFHRMTVLNFRFMDPQTLEAVKKDLSLSLTVATLCRLQQHFLLRERRDPSVAELSLCDLVAKSFYQTPDALRAASAEGDGELVRSFRDLCNKRAALFDTPNATLPEMLGVCGEFLRHSGVYPYTERLYCDTDAALAALCKGKRPVLAAELSHTSAAILQEAPASAPSHPRGALFLLSPTGRNPFSMEIARFLSHTAELAVTPLAVIGDEGMLPHLLRLDGAWLDLAALADYDAAIGPASLAQAGKGRLLLLCEEKAFAALRGIGPQLSFIGSASPSGCLQLRNGMYMLSSLPLSLLLGLQQTRTAPLRVTRPESLPLSVASAKTEGELLIGTETQGDAESATLSLFHTAFEMGAVASTVALTPALVLPAVCNTATLEHAFALALGFHRACCELLLPSLHPRVLYTSNVQAPCLALWLAARRGKERGPLPPAKSWQEARNLFGGIAE